MRPKRKPNRASKPKRASKRKKRTYKPRQKPPIKLGSPQFAALQKKYYAKLAQKGFKDIEWVDHSTGKGQQSSYLKGSDANKQFAHGTSTLDYYRLCSNFLVHNEKHLTPRELLVWHHWTEGKTLRDIVVLYNKRFKPKRYLYWIFRLFEQLEARCMDWNISHPEGLLNDANTDFYITDLPLKKGPWMF